MYALSTCLNQHKNRELIIARIPLLLLSDRLQPLSSPTDLQHTAGGDVEAAPLVGEDEEFSVGTTGDTLQPELPSSTRISDVQITKKCA